MSTPYSPLLLALEGLVRDQGLALSPAERERRRIEPLVYQSQLLEAGVMHFGTGFVDQIGRRMARLDGHPIVHGLGSSRSLPEMLERWLRFEAHIDPMNHVEAGLVAENVLEIEQTRADGSSMNVVEEALCVAIVAGFVEAFGMNDVRYEFATIEGGRRIWTVTWSHERHVPDANEGSWGIGDESAAGVFSVLIEKTNLSLARTARAVGVSGRTLQRRLEHVGTSFNELVRIARITRASRALLAHDASVTEIAFDAGFSDGAHLSREFRAFVGIPPIGFRRVFR